MDQMEPRAANFEVRTRRWPAGPVDTTGEAAGVDPRCRTAPAGAART